jgi:4-amino-4-deoxy-L-arabinose transferase-like glycosyltransferase
VAIACLNSAAWSIVIPPFQLSDEPDHFAYVQQLAESGRLPDESASHAYSPEEELAMQALHVDEVEYAPEVRPIASRAEQLVLERDLSSSSPLTEPLSAGVASTEPPLYYALETIPYALASHGTLLDRLELMRLFSALWAGLTVLFTFLFVRELLPADPLAQIAAALAVALTPMLAQFSGAVNPDAMLFAISAGTFYAVSRAFRRGLTQRMAAVIGASMAIGLLTKLNYIGLVPGVVLALAILARRAAQISKRAAYRALALALGIAASPVFVYVLVNLASGRPGLGVVSAVLNGRNGPVLSEISYIWQFYLPRLPGMSSYFPGVLMTRLWFNGFIGLFGWNDTLFPGWVYSLALLPAGAIALLCVRAIVTAAGQLRRRAAELLAYAVMAAGLLALIGANSYVSDAVLHIGAYWQPRYLLPLIPLLGAALALAVRGAGSRWAPVAATLIALLFLAQDLFGQLQTIARFYG